MSGQGQKAKNYYDLLELDYDAESQEIREKYKQAMNAYHSDGMALYSLISEDECARMRGLIEEAYTVLGDPQKREQYDDIRGLPGPREKATTPTLNISKDPAPSALERPAKAHQGVGGLIQGHKFQLDYIEDSSMEQKIESCESFTGEFLKEIREYKNVDIPKLCELTRVSKTHLRNIEEENVEKFSALVYVRGFVFQYAKCLKLNPDLVATSYMRHIKATYGL